jgi:hypothetical protein
MNFVLHTDSLDGVRGGTTHERAATVGYVASGVPFIFLQHAGVIVTPRGRTTTLYFAGGTRTVPKV